MYLSQKLIYLLFIVFVIHTLFIAVQKSNLSSGSQDRKSCTQESTSVENVIDVTTDGSSATFTNNTEGLTVASSKIGSYLLYIIIVSAPDNYLRRQAIRETWRDTVSNYDSIKYSFVMGDVGVTESKLSRVQKENERFGDILLLEGVEEVYTKLSRKVLRAFVWGGRNIDAVYYLKTDDDSYLVIDRLYRVLTEENKPTEKMLLGQIYTRSQPIPNGKWKELGWFLCNNYLDFPAGAGYILTQDVVKYLVHNSNKLMHYNNEDTSLGSWIAPLKLKYISDSRINILGTWCKSTDWLIHYSTPKKLRQIHFAMLNNKRFC